VANPEAKTLPVILKDLCWLLRIAIIAGLVVLGLGLVTILAQILGIRVLPTEDWVARARPVALAIGVAAGLGTVTLVRLGFKVQGQRMTVKNWLVLAFSALMGFWLGAGLVYTGPALIGATGQARVTHVYVVRDVPRSSDRRCRDAVKLDRMVFIADEICGVPSEVRSLLAPGMRVEVTGAGNALGLRPGLIRPLP